MLASSLPQSDHFLTITYELLAHIEDFQKYPFPSTYLDLFKQRQEHFRRAIEGRAISLIRTNQFSFLTQLTLAREAPDSKSFTAV